jgi:hypothetical protein
LHVLQLTPTRHVLPAQQPLEQLVASHTHVADAPVPAQRVPDGQTPPVEPQTQLFDVVSQRLVLLPAQVTHAAPTAPHALSVSGVTQLEPLQQPFGHNVELQPEQTPSEFGGWPHAPPAPHDWQTEPLYPHLFASVPPPA